jgi:hypothetical protein
MINYSSWEQILNIQILNKSKSFRNRGMFLKIFSQIFLWHTYVILTFHIIYCTKCRKTYRQSFNLHCDSWCKRTPVAFKNIIWLSFIKINLSLHSLSAVQYLTYLQIHEKGSKIRKILWSAHILVGTKSFWRIPSNRLIILWRKQLTDFSLET